MTPAIRDALRIAHNLLSLVESGTSVTQAIWDHRMGQIELALGDKTARAIAQRDTTAYIVTARRPRKIRRAGASR